MIAYKLTQYTPAQIPQQQAIEERQECVPEEIQQEMQAEFMDYVMTAQAKTSALLQLGHVGLAYFNLLETFANLNPGAPLSALEKLAETCINTSLKRANWW